MKPITAPGGTGEDTVIQFRFTGTGAGRRVTVSGPAKPLRTGTTAVFGRPYPATGTINTSFSPTAGMTVFAGLRSEPFFFDLNRFYAILPDRMTPLTGQQVDFPSILAADTPQVNGFPGFPPGSGFDTSPAQDDFANLNVLWIIVELPRASLGGGMIKLRETTSLPNGFAFVQQDRLARPAVNEALATVTARRHEMNNKDNPSDDRGPGPLFNDLVTFMANPNGANCSAAVANALATALTPDVMIADLSQLRP